MTFIRNIIGWLAVIPIMIIFLSVILAAWTVATVALQIMNAVGLLGADEKTLLERLTQIPKEAISECR